MTTGDVGQASDTIKDKCAYAANVCQPRARCLISILQHVHDYLRWGFTKAAELDGVHAVVNDFVCSWFGQTC